MNNYRIQGHSDSSPPCRKSFSKIKLKLSLNLIAHIGDYFRKLSNRLLLRHLRKVQRVYLWDFRVKSERYPLHFALGLELFFSSKASARLRQTWRATELHISFRVRTRETNHRRAVFWLGRKTQKFSCINQKPERTFLPVPYFSSRRFFPARLDFSSPPLSAPWSPRMNFNQSIYIYCKWEIEEKKIKPLI